MEARRLGTGGLGVGIGADVGLAIYVAGVAWGLIVIDAPLTTRLSLAILWPLGPIAFAVTVTVLFAASLIAFPALGTAVLLAGGAAWFWFF